MKFNVNDKVRVRLTDEGRKILEEQHNELYRRACLTGIRMPLYVPRKEDAEGWSEWQFWDLMSTFGSHLFNGCRVPFETIIDVPNTENPLAPFQDWVEKYDHYAAEDLPPANDAIRELLEEAEAGTLIEQPADEPAPEGYRLRKVDGAIAYYRRVNRD